MLQVATESGHVWYFNHLISFAVSIAFGYWVCIMVGKGVKDKVLHALISAGITFALLHLFWLIKIPWYWSSIGALLVGFGKEVADRLNKKKRLFDWFDILADIAGVGVVTVIYICSFLMVK